MIPVMLNHFSNNVQAWRELRLTLKPHNLSLRQADLACWAHVPSDTARPLAAINPYKVSQVAARRSGLIESLSQDRLRGCDHWVWSMGMDPIVARTLSCPCLC
jgi:hypothetical protein